MKMFLTLTLAVCATTTTAQSHWFVQTKAAAVRTSLQNAVDQSSGKVKTDAGTQPWAGVAFGWGTGYRWGFQGLSLGIGAGTWRQSTSGTNGPSATPLGITVTGTSDTKLDYLIVPLELRFAAPPLRKFQPFLTVGGYAARLLRYNEQQRSTYEGVGFPFAAYAEFEASGTSLRQEHATEGGALAPLTATTPLSAPLYRSWDFGARASAGVDYNISREVFLSLRLLAQWGFADVEDKEATTTPLTSMSWTQALLPGGNYWKYNTPKAMRGGNSPSAAPEERSATHTRAYGLELSIGYRFLPLSNRQP